MIRTPHHNDLTIQTATQPLAVSVSQACVLLGVSRSTIYRAVNRGQLTPRKLGARTLFLVSDLRDFLAHLPHAEGSAEQPGLDPCLYYDQFLSAAADVDYPA